MNAINCLLGETMPRSTNAMHLSSRGAEAHFAVAIALVAVLPCLTLLYLFGTAQGIPPLTLAQLWSAALGVALPMTFGYLLLARYPAAIIRLRAYLQTIAMGDLPDAIDLLASENDIAAIERALNQVLKMLSQKLNEVQAEKSLLQDELFQSQKLESLGTLASGVAHEINNPINGIMNYAQVIIDELGTDSPVAPYALEIEKETQRVAKVVTNLLSFARQDKQTHECACVCDIVDAVLSLVRTVMRHDKITLKIDIPPELPQVKCRSHQIQQVIMNLLTNARDALNEKYPQPDERKQIWIRSRVLQKGDQPWIRTTVEDHGMGIKDEIRQRIFDPFFTTKPSDKGTGLGLSVSHGIVKEHNGTLSVESEVAQFTRFHLDLPVDQGEEFEESDGALHPPPSEPRTSCSHGAGTS